jgi:fluoroquinolone transport system permease protein
MNATRVLRALGPIDAANIRRDSLLRWMVAMPLLFALLFRWVAAVARDWLAGFGVDLAPYAPLISSGIVLIAPMLYGVVIGFLLLDEKDDHTLTALRVTPLTGRGYITYRIAIPMVLSVLMTPVALALGGFSDLGVGAQLLAGAAAAPLAPAFALMMAAFARNKVQGFALMKASGIINWPPLIAWFVDSNWQLALGICPTYWPVRFYWSLEAGAAGAWLWFVVGTLYLAVIILLLLRRFERVVDR